MGFLVAHAAGARTASPLYRLRHGDWRYREERIVLSLDHDADGSLGELVESLSYGEEDPADRTAQNRCRV